ncbi:MAG: hypothetical protein IT177_10240 [Acidobacteria bacterium]|nr:hypothetical protein [Acidobacteriota bacterium]
MFKAVALSVALIVGIGPGATLLCRAWCDQHLAAVTGCHGPGGGDDLRVTTADQCDDGALAMPLLVQEDARRKAAPPASQALTSRAFAFVASPFDLLPPLRAESMRPPQAPPLSLHLRI